MATITTEWNGTKNHYDVLLDDQKVGRIIYREGYRYIPNVQSPTKGGETFATLADCIQSLR